MTKKSKILDEKSLCYLDGTFYSAGKAADIVERKQKNCSGGDSMWTLWQS